MEAPIRVFVMGSQSSGKSALSHRFASQEFRDDFQTTIGVDFHTRKLELLNCKLQIWDCGSYTTGSITAPYLRGSHVMLLVYDITNRESFDCLGQMLQDVADQTRDSVKILVAAKCDLEELRRVAREEGDAFAREHGMVHLQTSAMDNFGVERLFREAARVVLDRRAPAPCPIESTL